MKDESHLARLEFIVNTSKEFMTMISRDYRYVAANKAYCAAHNREEEAVVGKTISEIWGKEKNKDIIGYVDECFTNREVHYESWFEFPALGMRCFEVYCYPFIEQEIVTHIVVVSRDITERKVLEEKVFIDPLTGLYNYRYINKRIEEEFERASRYNLDVALLFADIDFFKKINDKLGHQGGNEILTHMANILSNSTKKSLGTRPTLRKADIIGRFGGEEFVVLLPETSKENAENIAERIRDTIENYNFPHSKDHPNVVITISIGIAAYPDDGIENPGDLIKKADLAMYDAKHKGRNRVSIYTG
ncbi:MAG: GGDEF domain-containing protein [Proteobacteria bacterium]|nr:GGDEF domain-containing protein [Pseudomonadota bacterium]